MRYSKFKKNILMLQMLHYSIMWSDLLEMLLAAWLNDNFKLFFALW